MPEKICKELEIKNQKGLHARAAASFVRCVEKFDAEVKVSRKGCTVGGSSIMGLMMLAASFGTKIRVEISGKEVREAFVAIEELIEGRFGED